MALLTAIALPLFVVPVGHDPFRLPKVALLRAGGIVTVWLLVVALLRKELTIGELFGWKRRENGVLLAITGVTLVSTLASSLPSASWKAFVTLLAAIALFIAAREALRPEIVRLTITAAACIIALLACLARLVGWSPWLVAFPEIDAGAARGLREATLLGNRNDVASFLAFWSVVFIARSRQRFFVKMPIAGLLVAGMLASSTLTAALAVLAGLTALLMREQAQEIRTKTLTATLVLASLFGSALYLSDQLSALEHSAVPLERATSNRWGAWLAAAAIGVRHPAAGVGPGAFGKHFAPERVSIADRNLGLFSTDHPQTFFSEAHSDFLQVFAELGLPGLIVLCWTLAHLIRRRATREPTITLTVLAAALFPLQLAAIIGPAAVWVGSELRRAGEQ